MLSNTLSLLTATTLLAHSVWGCCWHHGHEGECRTSATCAHVHVVVSTSHPAECTHSHSSVGTSCGGPVAAACGHDSDEDDGRHRPCRDMRCRFVNVKTSSNGQGDMLVVWAAAMPTTETFVTVASVPGWSEAANSAPPLAAQPLRAVTQSWLL